MDHKINAPAHGKNLVDGINATAFFKDQKEIFGDLKTNHTSNIGMFPCASKTGPTNFVGECLLNINSKVWFNKIKECKKGKGDNLNQNITPVFTAFKGTYILNKEEWN